MAITSRVTAKAALDQCGRFTRDEFYELLDVLYFPEDVRGFIAVFKLDGSVRWFNTFATAVADAVSGELMVLHKSLIENCTLKNGVNVHLNGYTLSSSNNNGTTLTDGGGAVSCVVFGQGNIIRSGDSGINGKAISLTGSGNIKFYVNNISAQTGLAINIAGTGTFTFKADIITAGNNGDFGSENHTIHTHTNSGKVYIHSNRIISLSTNDSDFAVYAQKGNVSVQNATIVKTDTNSTCVHKHEDAVIILKDNVYITDPATAGGCIGGTGDILLYGNNTANTAEVSGDPINLLVGTLLVSADVIDF